MTSDAGLPATIGAILAGGAARRLGGGDKALRRVGDRTVLERLVERVSVQVSQLILNANDDPARFRQHKLPIVADNLPDRPGPLAGILAALDWTAEFAPDIDWVVTVPGDAPFIPHDLVERLHRDRQANDTVMACAASQGRRHPVVALWPVRLRGELRRAVTEQGIRRIDRFTQEYTCAVVEWPAGPVDPFFNVNTPDDLAAANRLVELNGDL